MKRYISVLVYVKADGEGIFLVIQDKRLKKGKEEMHRSVRDRSMFSRSGPADVICDAHILNFVHLNIKQKERRATSLGLDVT